MNSKAVTVILARGGSKGIPGKNLIKLKGKPLLWYTINASLTSKVSETWVSTDCLEIKKYSLNLGCKVIDRPKEISCDHSKSEEALIHFAKNVEFDTLVFIQPTSPLLLSNDINLGLDKMKHFHSIISVTEEHWLPRWKTNGTPMGWNPKNRPMRQDIEMNFVENGAFYITTRNKLFETKLRFGGNIGFVKIPLKRSFQVDTKDDLELISQLL
jgi:N-acylneuraminate cytidylyltransferase